MATALPISYSSDRQHVLCIKSVPARADSEDVKKILEKYGKVNTVTPPIANSTSNFPYRFAYCPDAESMKSILKGIVNDNSGYRAEEKRKPTNSINSNSSAESKKNHNEDQNAKGNRILATFQEIDTNRSRSSQNSNDNRNSYSGRGRNQNRNSTGNKNEQTDVSKFASNNENKPTRHSLPSTKPYSIETTKFFNCFTCGKTATMCCQRCEEIYCSSECQDKDWPKHKYVCFKKPPLISIPHLNSKESDAKTDFGISKRPQQIEQKQVSSNISNNKTSEIVQSTQRDLYKKAAINKLSDLTSRLNLNGTATSVQTNNRNSNVSNLEQNNPKSSINETHTSTSKESLNSMKSDEDKKQLIKRKGIEKAPLPLSGQQIVLTHLDLLNRIYLRSNEKLAVDEYLKTISFVSESAKNSKYLTTLPNVKDMVLSQFEGDWYRALVLNPVNENDILIAYIDFGNAENKKLSDLKELHIDCYNFKRHPGCVTLKGLPSISRKDMPPKCLKFMQGLIDNFAQLKIKYNENEKTNNLQVVELFDYETNNNINEEIKNLLPSDSTDNKKNDKPVFFDDLEFVKLPPCVNEELVILDNSLIDGGFITCILSKDIDKIEETVKILKDYGSNDPNPYKPKETELCLVKVSDEHQTWYRASCESVLDNDRLELLFTDLGSICDQPVKNVRKYPSNLNIPCLSNMCFIKGFQKAANNGDIDDEVKSKLVNLLKNYTYLTVPKIELIGEENFIQLPDHIIDVIKERKIFDFNDSE